MLRVRRSPGEMASKPSGASYATTYSAEDSFSVAIPRGRGRTLLSYGSLLILSFVLTLPLVNPWVRGDGVGYYAYVRAMLVEHSLHFEKDWLAANPTFKMARVDSDGKIKASQYTPTGHLVNHFSVGPAMLWAPFLAMVHVSVLALNKIGAHVSADGYSRPYVITMALGTAMYGFLGIWFAFDLARKYFEERFAFVGTLGIWFGSSLPVYMYFNPSWSHAHSAFAVSLFLWYWHRTRGHRTPQQWLLLGACSGLMLDVYYPNAVLLLIPLLEALGAYGRALRPGPEWAVLRRLVGVHLLYSFAAAVVFLPTLVTRKIIYGSPFEFGYGEKWFWTSPALGHMLFSSNHGLLSWTPILIPALVGLFLFRRTDRGMARLLWVVSLGFYYLIASYSLWDGISSFGNRFFISLTPLFVLGLAAAAAGFSRLFERARNAFAVVGLATALFILWNVGLMFQWGAHIIPVRGPVVWGQVLHNQVAVVPGEAFRAVKTYLVSRRSLMGHIEQEDIKQLQKQGPEGR